LDVVDRVQAESLGDAIGHDLGEFFGGHLWRVDENRVEVTRRLGAFVEDELAGIDPVGVDDDARRLGLAEDLGQPHGLSRANRLVRLDLSGFVANELSAFVCARMGTGSRFARGKHGEAEVTPHACVWI